MWYVDAITNNIGTDWGAKIGRETESKGERDGGRGRGRGRGYQRTIANPARAYQIKKQGFKF